MLRELTVEEIGFVSGGWAPAGQSDTFSWGSGWDDDTYTFAESLAEQFEQWGIESWGAEATSNANDKASNVCPAGHTCVPAGDVKGHFVKDTSDGKLYMSEKGWEFYKNGPDIDWWGVARDLAAITGGSIGGVGGPAAAVSGMIGMVVWAIDYFRGDAN